MDEFQLLSQGRPADPPSAATVDRARANLLRLAEQPPPRRHRLSPRLRIALPVAAGVLAILAVGLAVRPTEPVPPPAGAAVVLGPVGSSPDEKAAQRFLLAAAESNLRTPAAQRGAYWVPAHEQGILIEVGPEDRRYAVMGRTAETWWNPVVPGRKPVYVWQWSGADPASAADRAAWRADGSPDGWVKDVPEGCPPDPADRWTRAGGPPTGVDRGDNPTFAVLGKQLGYEQVRALPADPAALKDWLLRLLAEQRMGQDSADAASKAAFDGIVNLLMETPVTPQVRSAAYQVLAEVPGVRSLGAVKDAHGRAGVAVSIDRNNTPEELRGDTGGPTEMRLVFDPVSGRTLGLETRVIRPADYLDWVPAGALFTYDLLVGERWTDDDPPALDYTTGEGEMHEPC